MPKAHPEKPKDAKNFTTAFLILVLVMISGQVINVVITYLPAAEEAVVDLGDGTSANVVSLRNSYFTLLFLVAVIYGVAWYGIQQPKNWARWMGVVLAVLAALGGAQRLLTSFAKRIDMVGLALALAQLIAAGWVLALAFRRDLHDWFTASSDRAPKT